MKQKEIPWKDAKLVLIDVPLDRTATDKILPFGLCLTDPPTGTIILADYPIFPYGEPYHEAIMMIHVKTLFGKGIHCAWILVDSDIALVSGREFLGYPKKMGQFTFSDQDGTISASVARRGVKLIDVKATRGAPEKNPAPVFAQKTFNLGGPGQWVAFSPLLLFKPTEDIHEAYAAEADLTLNDSTFDPIAKLVAGKPVSARIVRMDITGSSYYLPVGFTGGRGWLRNTFDMRFR